MRTLAAIISLLLISGSFARAQDSPSFYDFSRGSLTWYTIDTAHFKVHFHEDDKGRGSRRSATVVASIAEEIYSPITQLYDYEPDSKVSIVLRDFEDYSNGAAYFFDNVIVIWSPALDTPLRGRHDWLRNVVTHEFTHIVQVQAAMKADRRLPFQYFQLLTYEDVRRPDVLYGYPNGIVTYPIPVLNNPAWLAEGTAQYQRAEMDFDTWDSHRDMLLRTRVLAGEELSLAEMGGFYSHNSLERETVYNQGFAFTQYIASEFGEESLAKVSKSLGRWKVWTFDRAASKALGVSGDDLYDRWIARLRADYKSSVAGLADSEVAGQLVEEKGFLNLYPRYDPTGRRIAYLSNKGGDFSTTSLVVRDLSTGDELAVLDDIGRPVGSHTCALGHRVVRGVHGSFSWSNDGNRLLFARRKDTEDGSYYSDLYEYDIDAEKATRVTWNERARSPAYSPDGNSVAFISERDGTTNVFLIEDGHKEPRRITTFKSGEYLADPVWQPDGKALMVTRDAGQSNGIHRVDVATGAVTAVVDSPADERNPWIGVQDGALYFASDRTGIFNIYRIDTGASPRPVQLTNVVGGAFMPSDGPDGSLLFSRYDWDGYKIAQLDDPVAANVDADWIYRPPEVMTKWRSVQRARSDITGAGIGSMVDQTGYAEKMPHPSATLNVDDGMDHLRSDSMQIAPYNSTFTSFSFFPVLRLDQYVSRRQGRAEVRLPDRSRGETLLRNTKVGFYVASREILDGLSMLGGLLLGPASGDADSFGDYVAPSSLIDLERDLFVQFDYRKGIFLKDKRWSPQFSLQLFNVRRNVENGLAFEELACTACFPPDTTLADLSYNLWELDLVARSKITRHLLLEAGYRFSPYRVTTERFFSTEFQQTIPASSSRYYIGRALQLKVHFEALRRHRHADVVQDGASARLEYEFEPGRLLDRFEVEDGILSPKYESFRNHRITVDLKYGRRLMASTGSPHGVLMRLRGSTLLGGRVDDFFDDYVGGLVGARGYPFYALGGNETVWFQLSYSLPLFPDIHRQFWFLYADKLYARLYADAAYAWSGAFPGISEARKDVGAEVRLGLGSFYLLPTAVFVSATYGIDEFAFKLDDDFVTPDGTTSVNYGRDLQWHFGVLFGFDL